jgi:hypothetical protein
MLLHPLNEVLAGLNPFARQLLRVLAQSGLDPLIRSANVDDKKRR